MKLLGDTNRLSKWEIQFMVDCENGRFQEISLNYRAVSGRVFDMGLLAAALNNQHNFIRAVFMTNTASDTRSNLWNELYESFPMDYKRLKAYFGRSGIHLFLEKDLTRLDVRITNDWLIFAPDLMHSASIQDQFKKYNQMLRHSALIYGCADLYKTLTAYTDDPDGHLPDWLREDICMLGMQDDQNFAMAPKQKVFDILLDQMSPDWDMSYALYTSKSLEPYIEYGYRYEDFKHINNPKFKNVHINKDISQLKGIHVLYKFYLNQDSFSVDELKDVTVIEAFLSAGRFTDLLEHVNHMDKTGYITYVQDKLSPLHKKRYDHKLKELGQYYELQKISKNRPKRPSLKRNPRP